MMKTIFTLILAIGLLMSTALADGEWTCAACGAQNTKNFCTSCGQKPAEDSPWVCLTCFERNDQAYYFCGVCGSSKPNAGDRVVLFNGATDITRDFTQTASTKYVQDPILFFQGVLNLRCNTNNADGAIYSYSSEDKTLVKAYIDLLVNQNGNFAYASSYDTNDSKSWGVVYTGDAPVNTWSDLIFNEKIKVNISAYWSSYRKSGQILIPYEWEVVDLGYRYSGERVSTSVYGESAYAGLTFGEDGVFETTDGRLSTALGEATICIGGETYHAATAGTIEFELVDTEKLLISGYNKTDFISVVLPYMNHQTGDYYFIEALSYEPSEASKAKDIEAWNYSKMNSYRRQSEFAVRMSDVTCLAMGNARISENHVKQLTVRVMYYLPDEQIVLYIAAETDVAPYTVEVLASYVLNESANEAGAQSGSSNSASAGTWCITCGGDGIVEKCSVCLGSGTYYKAGVGTVTCYLCKGNPSKSCDDCGGDGIRGN